jgi:16S rRNA (cytosine967-C5)-methyltransferase
MKPRQLVSIILTNLIIQKKSLKDLLPQYFPQLTDQTDRSFVQEICFGVSRWYYQLEGIAQQLLQKPFSENDDDVFFVILVGLYEALYMRTKEHAIVFEAVETVKALQKDWAAGVVNAVLRNFLRDPKKYLKPLQKDDSLRLAHPRWLLERFKHAWPIQWQAICEANNQQAPLSLRVNLQKITREQYLEKLQAQKIAARQTALSDAGVVLEKACRVEMLPGFSEGEVSVQDISAQMVVDLLDLQLDQRVLDACAAPGGKTAHILEKEPHLKELVALDWDETRLSRVKENLDRLQLSATLIHADAANPDAWWDKQPFDRILLDAPCSATGVIRRHPDIKLLRRKTDMIKLAKQQKQLLKALWPLLKPQGLLVYVTCSILPQENQQVIQAFLEETPDAEEKKLETKWGVRLKHGRQMLPGEEDADGFYYAVLQKK